MPLCDSAVLLATGRSIASIAMHIGLFNCYVYEHYVIVK